MKISLTDELNEFLKIIAKNALIQKTRVFFVGGFVRDNILGKATQDIDLIVEGNAIEFCENIKNSLNIKSIHKDFATVKVCYKNITTDIASTRSEIYPYSGSLPLVKEIEVKLEKDVKRRDFTINSLYLEIKLVDDELDFELIDLVDGVKDINSKTLKVLHKKSYIDDPTRILRGLDFKYRFNFDFSFDDKKLINEYLCNINYENRSDDRIKSVFLKVLSSKNNNKIFKDIIDNKIYKILFNKNISVDFHKTDEIIKKFNLDNKNISSFYFLIMENNKITKLKNKNRLEIYKNFSKFDMDYLAYYYYKTNDDNIDVYLEIKNIKLLIKGQDLLNLNYPQGKLIGEILDNLLLCKLENSNPFLKKEDEINWVLKHYPCF